MADGEHLFGEQVCGGDHNQQDGAAVDFAGPCYHCRVTGDTCSDHRHQALHH